MKRKVTQSGWVSFDCPCCMDNGETRPDSKQRGGVHCDMDGSIVYHCFNCGFKTGFKGDTGILPNKMKYLLSKLGVPSLDIDRMQFQIAKEFRERANTPNAPTTVIFKMPTFNEVSLPQGAKPISYWAAQSNPSNAFVSAIDYLYDRGQEIFNGYEYYWTPHMRDRIIIPYWWKDTIVGWSARHVGPPTKTIRKYMKDVQPDFIFNYEAALRPGRKFVLVVEGEFDAIALDAVSPLGRKLSAVQANMLKRTGKQIVMLGDREIKEVSLVDFAADNNFAASFPMWDTNIKDAADATKRYGRLLALKTVIDNIKTDPDEIRFRKKTIRSFQE